MLVMVFLLGIIIFIIGGIWLIITAFRTSVLWGLGALLISPVALIYTIVHWPQAKEPFKLQILGLLMMFIGAYMAGYQSVPQAFDVEFSQFMEPDKSQFIEPPLEFNLVPLEIDSSGEFVPIEIPADNNTSQ